MKDTIVSQTLFSLQSPISRLLLPFDRHTSAHGVTRKCYSTETLTIVIRVISGYFPDFLYRVPVTSHQSAQGLREIIEGIDGISQKLASYEKMLITIVSFDYYY